MHITVLCLVFLLVFARPAIANDTALLEEIAYLKNRIAAIEMKLVSSTEENIKVHHEVLGASENSHPSWTDQISLSGVVEGESAYLSPYTGDSESDQVIAKVVLAIEATINPSTAAVVTLIYKEDGNGFNVNEAFISHRKGNATYTFGQVFLPFGFFESAMTNDPLTLSVAETKETALLYNYESIKESNTFSFHAYLFNGDSDIDESNHIKNWGLGIDYESAHKNITYGGGLDYISNIADSKTLGEFQFALNDRISAVSASVYFFLGANGFTFEHINFLDSFPATQADFNNHSADITINHFEYTRGVSLSGKNITLGLGYQQTEELLFTELPESRLSFVITGEISSGIALSLEIFEDNDYSSNDVAFGEAGTGKSANGLVFQLAAEF
jgi:ankyrin repeat protein